MSSKKSQLYLQITSQFFEHIKWEYNNYLFNSQSFCSQLVPGNELKLISDECLILLSNCLRFICKTIKRVLTVRDSWGLFHTLLYFSISLRAGAKPFCFFYWPCYGMIICHPSWISGQNPTMLPFKWISLTECLYSNIHFFGFYKKKFDPFLWIFPFGIFLEWEALKGLRK